MRRPGYLIAAAVLALITAAGWFIFFSPAGIERTLEDRVEAE